MRVEHLIKPGTSIAANPNHFVIVRVDGDRLSLEVVAAGNAPYLPYGTPRVDLNR